MKYRIWEAVDGSERATVREGGHQFDDAVDLEGRKMKLVKEYESSTYNEAMQISNDHFGYGKYHPMDPDPSDPSDPTD